MYSLLFPGTCMYNDSFPDMVVSGVPKRNGLNQHAIEIARMSLALIHQCKTFVIPHEPNQPLMIRVGIHAGGY